MTPNQGSTMCPHNESRPQWIHGAREGPFARSRAVVSSPPPPLKKHPGLLPPSGEYLPFDEYVQAWDDKPPHGPLRAQCRLVGGVGLRCMRSRAGPGPDLSSFLLWFLSLLLFALQPAHGGVPAPLPHATTAYCTPLPMPHFVGAREQQVVWESFFLYVRHW